MHNVKAPQIHRSKMLFQIEPQPLRGEGQEEADAVSVGPIQQEVRRHRDQRREKGARPTDRLPAHQPHHHHRQQRHRRHGHQGVRQVPVIMQITQRSPGRRDDIDIRRIGRQQ